MKSELKRFLQLIAIFFKAFFTFKKKVWIFSIPSHPNLGDQAQLMCTEKWVRENYDGCKNGAFVYAVFWFRHKKVGIKCRFLATPCS